MTTSAVTLDIAREIVIRTQNPSIAALQAATGLGYTAASKLIEELRQEHLIQETLPGRQLGIHPDYRRVQVLSIKGDARLNYIARVVHLALFFFELCEEGSDAHSQLIRDQLPAPGLKWRQVQALFRQGWYGTPQALSLTDAALAFDQWLCEQGASPQERNGVEAGIRAGCAAYERPFSVVTDSQMRLQRSYMRLARFYKRTIREDITQHSRVVERFVPNALAPQNVGRPGQHPEHVVPCADIGRRAREYFDHGWSIHDVASLLQRWLVIVWIDQKYREVLDHGQSNLKSHMPIDWDPLNGCAYARLHFKEIPFTPASGRPCICTGV